VNEKLFLASGDQIGQGVGAMMDPAAAEVIFGCPVWGTLRLDEGIIGDGG
jgi:hypothetical protein